MRQVVREAGLMDAAHASTGLYRVTPGEHHMHAASPWVLDGERYDSRRRAPRLGEHTAAVLGDLAGLTPDEIADLEGARGGVVANGAGGRRRSCG